MTAAGTMRAKVRECLRIKNKTVREAMAEMLSTFVMMERMFSMLEGVNRLCSNRRDKDMLDSLKQIKPGTRKQANVKNHKANAGAGQSEKVFAQNIREKILCGQKYRVRNIQDKNIMKSFGLGSVAQVVLGRKEFGQYLSINLSFGFGVTMGILVAGGVSGAHMNTSVSLTNCILGNLPWRKLPVYALAQCVGSFLAAAVIFSLYYEALINYCGGNLTVTGPCATAGIFSTYPEPYLSLGGGFVDQVIGTAALLLCIMAINDQRNNPALNGTQALLVGILVVLIGMAMGMNSGYAINPARDLPPRIFTAIAGWGLEVFWAGNNWWWVPVVAPMVGSVTGALIYTLFIELHHPPEASKESKCPETKDSHNADIMCQPL